MLASDWWSPGIPEISQKMFFFFEKYDVSKIWISRNYHRSVMRKEWRQCALYESSVRKLGWRFTARFLYWCKRNPRPKSTEFIYDLGLFEHVSRRQNLFGMKMFNYRSVLHVLKVFFRLSMSMRIFRLGASALNFSIGDFRLGSFAFAWKLSLCNFRLGSFVKDNAIVSQISHKNEKIHFFKGKSRFSRKNKDSKGIAKLNGRRKWV